MKIAYCIGALNLGGIATVAHNLSTYFTEKNIEFEIITTHHKGNDFDRASSMGWPLIDISNNEPSLKKRLQITYETLIKYDVVINNHSDEVKFCLPALPAKIVKISVQHNTTIKSSKALALNADYLNYWAGVSPAVTDVIKKYNPNYNRIAVLPNGVQKLTSKKHHAFEDDKVRITYVGRLNQKQKNIFILPAIVEKLKNKQYNIELIIAGDGEDKQKLEYLFNKKGLNKQVIFLGRIGSNEVEKLFSKSSFLINPSFWEGLPMVVLEALSCGLIPVLSNIEPHQYLLGEKLKKELICGFDIEKYASTIIALHKDKKKYLEITQELIYRWDNYFSIGAFGKNYEDLIQNAFQNPIKYTPQNINKIKLPLKEQLKMTLPYRLLQKIHRISK